jgi:hypothetical protein
MRSRALARLRRRREWESPPALTVDGRVLLRPRRAGRVHLGCGEISLDGYLNVDLPPAEGTARGHSRPDVEADIRALDCPGGTLAEIRLHHVFEHFERPVALALLVRWHDWLAPGGVITIETPDFERSVEAFAGRSIEQQTLILRHLFGSQEAPWATHRDGWSERRFIHVLRALGFEDVSAASGASDEEGLLKNVVIQARTADPSASRDERVHAAHELMKLSMNGWNETELALLARWTAQFDALVSAALMGGRHGDD